MQAGSTDRAGQASSASFFSQAEMPCLPAFRRYLAFSWGVTRTWICCVAGFFFLGAPRARLVGWSMV